jgi:hypothetical protein
MSSLREEAAIHYLDGRETGIATPGQVSAYQTLTLLVRRQIIKYYG